MNRATYDAALRLLEHRPRAEAELRRALIRKGQHPADVEVVLERLRDQKLLDDAEFALQFARRKVQGAGTSRLRIVQELSRRGVARAVADAAVRELRDSEGIDPSAAIHRVAEKKWNSLATLDDFTRRRRLYAFLARRGFNPDEIRGVMNTIGAALDE